MVNLECGGKNCGGRTSMCPMCELAMDQRMIVAFAKALRELQYSQCVELNLDHHIEADWLWSGHVDIETPSVEELDKEATPRLLKLRTKTVFLLDLAQEVATEIEELFRVA